MPISELVENPTGGAVSRRWDRGPALNIDPMDQCPLQDQEPPCAEQTGRAGCRVVW